MEETKRCPKCGETKPVQRFAKNATAKSGVGADCIDCRRAYQARYHKEHRTERQAYYAEWYAANRAKAIAKVAEWHAAHPESVRAAKRKWKEANPGRSNNPAVARARVARWNINNPDRRRANDAAGRAKKRGARLGCRRAYAAFVRWARTTRRISCYWCKRKTKQSERHLDHVIPLSKGGADSAANLCVSCPPCNGRKHAKLPEDFAGQAELRLT